MGKIVLLDDLTINKIAAGEVIERPASCVKEMCENSVDSGAKNITIEIRNGGISYIKIVDDGCGISEDDMEIAFERHATSKIRSAEDLEKVKTMGFRGEALASIAAISQIEMISKRPEDEVGHRIVIEGGNVLEKGECGAPNGTSITVKNLFFNTPVRYKFLNSGKKVLQTTGNGDIKDIVYSIYGKDVADGITEVEYIYEDIKISGVIGNSSIARSNRNGQIFFVNQRYVKDKTLTAAVDQAYKDILPMNKYGFVILNLEIDPSKIDCNVHPAKLEIRFEDEQKVFKAVYHAIKSKNEEIINKTIKMSEIKNQEELEEVKESQEKVEEESSKVEKEEFKPREGTFSGFFKMFKNNKEDEEKNTLIEDLYTAKKNGGLNWSNLTSKDEEKIGEEVSKDIEKLEKEESPQEVKLGNTIISSDTRESAYDVNDLIKAVAKQETMKLDTTKLFSAHDARTEVIDSLKKIEAENNRETVIVNTEEVRNEISSEEKNNQISEIISEKEIKMEELANNTIAERLLEQKVKSDMDDTQFIDTGKVRDELRNSKVEDDIPMTKDFANMYKKVFRNGCINCKKNKGREKCKA